MPTPTYSEYSTYLQTLDTGDFGTSITYSILNNPNDALNLSGVGQTYYNTDPTNPDAQVVAGNQVSDGQYIQGIETAYDEVHIFWSH